MRPSTERYALVTGCSPGLHSASLRTSSWLSSVTGCRSSRWETSVPSLPRGHRGTPSSRGGTPCPRRGDAPRPRAGPDRWRRGRNRWDRSQPDRLAVAPLARTPARAAPPSRSPFDARGYAPRPTRLASEQHLESVALEARLPHREALEGLGQD